MAATKTSKKKKYDLSRKDRRDSNPTKFKWDNTCYVRVYEYARDGLSGRKLAAALGMSKDHLIHLKQTDPAFADAIERARRYREKDGKAEDFLNYVYKRLPPKLQVMWDKIAEYETEENGILKIEALLAKGGTYVRMHLFMHALVCSDFNVSRACRKVNITIGQLNHWATTNPDFAEIIKQIHIFKKDFFESALVKAVRRGETSAVIFANRTYNRDRGYNDKVEMELKGTGTNLIDIGLLNLPLDIKKVILDKWRKYKEQQSQVAALEYERQGDKAVPIETEAEENKKTA